MGSSDIMQKMGAMNAAGADAAEEHVAGAGAGAGGEGAQGAAKTVGGAAAQGAQRAIGNTNTSAGSDSLSNDEKHANLLKGAGEARVRTREELTHREAKTAASERSDAARKRNMFLGLALAVVVVVFVLVALVLLGANSAL